MNRDNLQNPAGKTRQAATNTSMITANMRGRESLQSTGGSKRSQMSSGSNSQSRASIRKSLVLMGNRTPGDDDYSESEGVWADAAVLTETKPAMQTAAKRSAPSPSALSMQKIALRAKQREVPRRPPPSSLQKPRLSKDTPVKEARQADLNAIYDDPYLNPGRDLKFGMRGRRNFRKTPTVAKAPAAKDPLSELARDYAQRFRYKCGVIVNHPRFQQFVVYLIAVNAIMMGLATYPIIMDDPVRDAAFELVDQVFLIVFTVELVMQFAFHGARLFTDGWLVFDFVVILISWSLSRFQIIRAFRIFRALRLITRVKVMKNLIKALFDVMPRMFGISLLLLLVSYIFAVMLTQLWKEKQNLYFGSLDRTFFTLFQMMTLDGWADVCRTVQDTNVWGWIPIVMFVITTGFVVVNLIIAVICDAISALNEDDKAKFHGKYEESEDASEEQDDEDGVSVGSSASSFDSEGNPKRSKGQGALKNDEPSDDLQAQLDVLEEHIENLSKLQERTLQTLELLNRRIAEAALGGEQREELPPISSG